MSRANLTKLANGSISYLRRMVESNELEERDLLHYFRKIIRNLLYLNSHHPIIKRCLIKKGNIVVLRHNSIKYKSSERLTAKGIKRRNKEYALTWSKRVVVYLKRHRILLTDFDTNDSQWTPEPPGPQLRLEPEIIKKLEERMIQYKNSTGIWNNLKINGEISETVEASTSKLAISPSESTLPKNGMVANSPEVRLNEKRINSDNPVALTGQTFLDNLINKLKNDRGVIPAHDQSVQKKRVSTVRNSTSKPRINEDVPRDDSESSNSSDFCGFNDTDGISGLLPTPIVPNRKQSDKSAFVSEDLDAFLRENSLENSANVELPKTRRIEEGMVCEGAQPPKMSMQAVPEEFAKARTVAEKRLLLQKKRNTKYFIIENENTIYRELKKRSKYGQWNENLIANLQQADIPFTRDCWKATSWLRTLNGKFCFQTLTIDGENYKLIGTRGNHHRKILGVHKRSPISKRLKIGCPPGCRQELNIKSLNWRVPKSAESKLPIAECKTEEKPKYFKLLDSHENKPTYKPAPLSKKCQSKLINRMDGGEIGIYEMPSVQLEVFPKVNHPLDENVKPYLKLILPSDKISREWAEFAVSTLMTKPKTQGDGKCIENGKKSFTFNIPYLNQQKTLLVRKIVKRNEKPDPEIGGELTFLKDINIDNPIELTCASVLTEMIDSVALGSCEDSLIKYDPWIDYDNNKIKDVYTKREVERTEQFEKEKLMKVDSNKQKTPKRLLNELKRLNATIVKAGTHCTPEIVKCEKQYCQLGCICHSVTGAKTPKNHCGKAACMFACSCTDTISINESDSNCLLSKEDAMLLREKATARLAKVEKEFCATLVLTGNTSYLLNESKSAKRRPTRVPKRFSDFVHEEVSVNTRETEAASTSDEKSQSEISYAGSLEGFKHCNVYLPKIKGLKGIEPWCMIHRLYRCYCKGKAVEGEPFCFEQSTDIEEVEEPQCSRKRHYPFEQVSYQLSPTTTIKRKYYSAGYVSGSRTSAIPSHVYRKLNFKKVDSLKAKITAEETEEKNMLLKRRVYESMGREKNAITNAIKAKHAAMAREKAKQASKPDNSIASTCVSSSVSASSKESNKEKIESKQSADMEKIIQCQTEKSLPVISSVMTLNTKDDQLISNGKISTNQFHKRTVGLLNLAVTKTMQSISKIQSQDLKHIPSPVPGTLCSTQWRHFLKAFKENRIFVWEVCVQNHSILVATKQNAMPQIPSAICAANIRILPRENLPWVAQLLLSGTFLEAMKTISVLMAGQNKYWRIIGCTNSKTDYTAMQCIVKPTPHTHPKVSSKVNELYQLLYLREMENYSQRSRTTAHGNRSVKVSSTRTSTEQGMGDICTNLEFKKVTPKDVESIIIPIPNKKDHLWLMMNLEGDFSHIYVPEWKDFLTFDRIKKSFEIAINAGKTVRLGSLTSDAHIYATPHSSQRLYIGPFFEDTKIGFVLCQNFDGKIISREDYEKSQNIKHIRKTVAYWLRIQNSTLVCDSVTPSDDFIRTRPLKDEQLLRIVKEETGYSPKISSSDVEKVNAKPLKIKPTAAGFTSHSTNDVKGEEQAKLKQSRSLLKNNIYVKGHVGKPVEMNQKKPKEELHPSNSTKSGVSSWKEIKRMFDLTPEKEAQSDINGVERVGPSTMNSSNSPVKKIQSRQSLVPKTIASRSPQPNCNQSQIPEPNKLQQKHKTLGYFVSNDRSLGKIMGGKTTTSYFVRMKLGWEWLSFPSVDAVNAFLKNMIRTYTKGRYNNPLVEWRFISVEHKDCDNFRPFSLENIIADSKRKTSLLKPLETSQNIVAPQKSSETMKSSSQSISLHPPLIKMPKVMKTSSMPDIKRPRNLNPTEDNKESNARTKFAKLAELPSPYEVILIDD